MLSQRIAAGLATMAMTVAAAAPAQAATHPPAAPQADGIIAILIGAVAPFTPPIGSNKGSFIDASAIYGSAD